MPTHPGYVPAWAFYLLILLTGLPSLVTLIMNLTKSSRHLRKWYKEITAEGRKTLSGSIDEKKIMDELLRHVKHHADEGMMEDVDVRWLASMQNLVKIIQMTKGLPTPSANIKLERLFLHWINDPKTMNPPPGDFVYSASRVEKKEPKKDDHDFSGS